MHAHNWQTGDIVNAAIVCKCMHSYTNSNFIVCAMIHKPLIATFIHMCILSD